MLESLAVIGAGLAGQPERLNPAALLEIDTGDLVFAFALIVGFVLLLVTVVLDDFVSGALDAVNIGIDVGGVSVAPIAMGFVAMFGIGGLFGTQILHMGSGIASVVGALFGIGGAVFVYVMFGMLVRGQSQEAYSMQDLVGMTGRVVVGIPKGRYGEVMLSFAGTSQKRTATADADVAAGTMVQVTGVAGSTVIVEPAPR